jgi:hypothetical protein
LPSPDATEKAMAQPTPSSDRQARQLVLVKKDQRWVFRYVPGQETAVLRAMAATAADPQSDFDWFDAAVLCNQLGGNLQQQLKALMPS